MLEIRYEWNQHGMKQWMSGIQCLSKIGKELLFDIQGSSLTIRCLNDSHSVSGELHWSSSGMTCHMPMALSDELLQFKIYIKMIQFLFKHMKHMNTMIMKIMLHETSLEVVELKFEFTCEFDIIKVSKETCYMT